MCSLFWCLSVPGRYYRFKSVGQRVGAIDVRVGSRGEVTACPLCSWKRTSPGTRETSALGPVQIVILRVLHILTLFCLIAGAVVGLQLLDKTHYLSMEVPLARGRSLSNATTGMLQVRASKLIRRAAISGHDVQVSV